MLLSNVHVYNLPILHFCPLLCNWNLCLGINNTSLDPKISSPGIPRCIIIHHLNIQIFHQAFQWREPWVNWSTWSTHLAASWVIWEAFLSPPVANTHLTNEGNHHRTPVGLRGKYISKCRFHDDSCANHNDPWICINAGFWKVSENEIVSIHSYPCYGVFQ